MGMMVTGVDAQVSVRRGGSRNTEKKAEKKAEVKLEPKAADKVGKVDKKELQTQIVKSGPIKNKLAQKTADGVTLRQQNFDEYQRQNSEYTPWQHVIYRELDMNVGQNASLYYPVEPMDGLTNMFRVLLTAMCDGKLTGYEYLDGREVFSDKYRIKTEEMLEKFQIPYSRTTAGNKNALAIDETDVPCHEVMSYYIKERWEFNSQTGSFGPRVLAVCPVLHRAGDFGGEAVKYPMFWIDYEDARPLLRQYQIMSDGMNNAARYTMEDFFTLHQYEGEIYKVQNTRGLTLAQQYPNPDSLKVVRQQIEARLHGFSDGIWVASEDENTDVKADDKKADKKAAKADVKNDSDAKEVKRNRRTKEEISVVPRHSAVRRR